MSKFGLDKELEDRVQAKYDYEQEKRALDWLAEVTGHSVSSIYPGLKNGVILCKLIQKIKPGLVRQFSEKPTHVLTERENIKAYIAACATLGVRSQDLFQIDDLHSKKYLTAVLNNIFALARQAQVIPGFTGPKLGVTNYVSLEEQENRWKKRQLEKQLEAELAANENDRQKKRRLELENQKQIKRSESFNLDQRRLEKRRQSKRRLGVKVIERKVSPSPVRFGMDLEVQQKIESKYDYQAEAIAMDWIESITGEEIDDFYTDLKSGEVLCKLINCISPGLIKKIHNRPIPQLQRENIQNYLKACGLIGVKNQELFVVSDLYESKSLAAVILNIEALGRTVGGRASIPDYPKLLPEVHYLKDNSEDTSSTPLVVEEVPPTPAAAGGEEEETTIEVYVTDLPEDFLSPQEQDQELIPTPDIKHTVEVSVDLTKFSKPVTPPTPGIPVKKGGLTLAMGFALYLCFLLGFLIVAGPLIGFVTSFFLALVLGLVAYCWFRFSKLPRKIVKLTKKTIQRHRKRDVLSNV
eukprot:TRINITY_DN7065_c0_g2_i1.p1 TRINITY_DN7065_c0_g2~~TRINITY_DN7065_c0_g2_i1.p1  ORF type:complete len:524 (-),score=101.24 TRINITY_DN7065_c0_g2_i1:2-1573(-)